MQVNQSTIRLGGSFFGVYAVILALILGIIPGPFQERVDIPAMAPAVCHSELVEESLS